MQYKIVFFDIDGTLLNSSREIPKSTVDAMDQLRKVGIVSAIASARTPYNTHYLLDDLPVDTYIFYNGGLIFHKDTVLHQDVIASSTVDSLVTQAVQNHHSAMPEGREHFSLVSEEPDKIIETYAKMWDHAKRVPFQELKDPVSQIDLFCKDEEVDSYINAFPNLTFYPWASRPSAFNVIPKGVSKAYGIQLILQKLGFSKAESVAFGDGPNDLEMLAYVGTGVAMGNAVDELKAKADFITKHVDDDGIAYGLRHLGMI